MSSNQDDVWTVRRHELFSWFVLSARNLAPVYAGAVRMVFEVDFPGRVHFVWHAIREIQNRLPEALSGEIQGGNFQYGPAVQELELRWTENDLRSVSDSAEPSVHGQPRLPPAVTTAIEQLLDGHAAIGARNDAKAEALFTTLTQASVPPYVVKAWRTVGRTAHKLAHVHATPVSADDEAALVERFLAFEAGLLALVGRTFENMDDLDDILNVANS